MHIFDRFISQTSSPISSDHSMELIALSCYHLAKKLRTNTTINDENEQLSLIFSNADYNDEEIFVSIFERVSKRFSHNSIVEYRTNDCSNTRLGFRIPCCP